MQIRLKPVRDQVVVVTGASSGIGLATARMAARRGARVVLAARDEPALHRVVAQIRAEGGDAVCAVADVADPDQVRGIVETAVGEFGGLDTWVNNAAVAIYGRIEDTPVQDARRLFDTNYWGMVNGSLAALPYLRQNGGALINVASVVADRTLPLQGHYGASKHAVKGFTDALRMEVEHDGAPVAVTLIKPGSIHTPFTQHARNLMEREPDWPPPVYQPEIVARAILFCAEHPRRCITVGGGGRMIGMMGMVAPRMTDRLMERTMFWMQQKPEPAPPNRRDALYQPPVDDARLYGDYPGKVRRTSTYTRAALHSRGAALGLAALGALAVYLSSGARRRGPVDVEVELEGDGRMDDRTAAWDERRDEAPAAVPAAKLEMRSDDWAQRATPDDLGEPEPALAGADYGLHAGVDQAH